jgi:hypothetical protein
MKKKMKTNLGRQSVDGSSDEEDGGDQHPGSKGHRHLGLSRFKSV